jgi:eukaryotic-like serine/threonine-protein kinase
MSDHETSQTPIEPSRLPPGGGHTDPASNAETELYQRPGAPHVSDVVPVASESMSDVKLAESGTAGAPSFRAPAPAPGPVLVPRPPMRRNPPPPALTPGAEIDDFEVVRLLGRGAFGHVYLARQISLDREVALKVSANRGSEGRTMARLEHAHIVQVFSEKVDETSNQRLLCMQLVPGVGLEKIIGALHAQLNGKQFTGIAASEMWSGNDLLAVIDLNATMPAALDPAALRDREALSRMDAVESTAWMGARLAEALDFAHQRGVLHRDIKPANILVSPYGRPMLADFNISSQQAADDEDELFGGTIAYMAPEHLDAFNPEVDTPHEAVTAQADIYSLGIVLNQLLVPRIAPVLPERRGSMADTLREIAEQRRNLPPKAPRGVPDACKTLHQTICHCMAPLPANRFASGAALAEQLEGCRQLRQAEQKLPAATGVGQSIIAHPFRWFVLLVVLPQLVASAINISYNMSQIASELSSPQRELFLWLVNVYNMVVYPPELAVFGWVIWRVWRVWNAMCAADPLPAGEVATARRKALRLPLWLAGLIVIGWLPGGVLFPAIISARTESLPAHTWIHFIASFTISGLIALAYSLCGSQFVVQRALYPRMWDDVRHFTDTARKELAPMADRLWWIQFFAESIPLLAACLMVPLIDPDSHPAFRVMVIGLIFLGFFGSQLTTRVTRGLTETVAALTGAKS